MFLLQLSQNDYVKILGLVKSKRQGRIILKKIEAYQKSDNEEILVYSLLKDYQKIMFHKHQIIISKYSFENEKIYVDFIPIVELYDKNCATFSSTKIGAYMINDNEVEEYITLREKNFNIVKKLFEKAGYIVKREFFGSEDGEAITLYLNENDQQMHRFFMHLDPCFVYEKNIEKLVEEFLKYE